MRVLEQNWIQQAESLPIRFAQVREDPSLDQSVITEQGGTARVMMVASGGCSAAFLATLPLVGSICLVDLNAAQLALSRFKLRLLSGADPGERLELLGHRELPAETRAERLEREFAALGWEADALGPFDLTAASGPDYVGRYERLFAALQEALMLVGSDLGTLLSLDHVGRQSSRASSKSFLGKELDRAFVEIFQLPTLVRLFGDAATGNRAVPFSEHFLLRIREAFARFPANENPWLWQLFRGEYPEGHPVPWLSQPRQPRLPEISYVCSSMLEALEQDREPVDFLHLSNILDWQSPEQAGQLLEAAASALRPGGSVLIRQLNSSLEIRKLGPQFAWLEAESARLLEQDRSFFYRVIHWGKKR